MIRLRTIEREIAGALICSNDDKILLGRAAGGAVYSDSWCAIGGGIDNGETPKQAATREIAEETGINIDESSTWIACDVKHGESKKTLKTGEKVIAKMKFNDFFIKIPQSSEELILARDEREWAELRWFSKKEITQINLSSPTNLLFKQLNIIKE